MNLGLLDLPSDSLRTIRASYLTESGRQIQDRPCQNRYQRNPQRTGRASEDQDTTTGSEDTGSAEVTLFASDPLQPDDSHDSNHLSRLRLLTGWLDDMSFAEVATVVGIDQFYLRDVLHEKRLLRANTYSQIERMLDLTRRLRLIMQPEIIGWWYRTSDPKLSGKSPLELLADNRSTGLEQIELVVSSYFDISYG